MRLHVGPLGLGPSPEPGLELDLPPAAARHVQVLRLQGGDRVQCFDGGGTAWWAEVLRLGRQSVAVRLVELVQTPSPEPGRTVRLAVGMPANDRMDFLVEKATELGMGALQPLMCERSVLRLSGERAERKVAHWSAVAASAAEQSGRRRVPEVRPVVTLAAFLQEASADSHSIRLLLHPAAAEGAARSLPFISEEGPGSGVDGRPAEAAPRPVWLLSGPEGGLAPTEVDLALRSGFTPVSLGPRVLRADTAPLAWLAHWAIAEA